MVTRTYLKNVFWPSAFFGGIGASFQILDILQYACGLKLGPAAILNQNPIFEMGSKKAAVVYRAEMHNPTAGVSFPKKSPVEDNFDIG
jgi:hypothetical protein